MRVEKIAFHVLSESIRRLSSEPVSIIPLDLNTIRNHFKRDKQDNQSTEFAFSRFINLLIYLIMRDNLFL